jgi:hypothetical protein
MDEPFRDTHERARNHIFCMTHEKAKYLKYSTAPSAKSLETPEIRKFAV